MLAPMASPRAGNVGIATRALRELPSVPEAERARLLALPPSAAAHAECLARLPFHDALEVAPAPAPPAREPARLRAVAWNAERGRRLEGASALLARSGADVFLLCELDHGMARSGQRHTARELARALGCGYAFGVEFLELGLGDRDEAARCAGQHNAVGYHGGAILSRLPLLRCALVRLETRGEWFGPERGQPRVGGRIAVLAKVRAGGGELALASVHLESHGDPAGRAEELARLLGALGAFAPGAPVLLGGDLNTHTLSALHGRDREALRRALAEHPARLLEPVAHEPLFASAAAAGFEWREANATGVATVRDGSRTPSRRGGLKLDWFLYRGLRARDPEVIAAVDPASGAALSDHEAIAVTVEPA
jgi:endonuclease/exonuclease/phosphatase family metal-dependent hydrolase